MVAAVVEEEHAVDTNTRRNGQAAVEFIIGLLVLVTILAGGIQYLYVANAHRSITTTLRAEAGERALRNDILVDIPPFLRDWKAGRDTIRHTDDDTAVTGSGVTLGAIARRSARQPADWERLTPLPQANPMATMRASPMPMVAMALVKAERSERVVVDPAVRELIYDRPTVTVRHTVWLPLLGGLY